FPAVGRDRGRASGGGLGAAHRRLDAGVLVPVTARDVAHPEKAEDDRHEGTDRGRGPADDQPDEDADDPDREADRPQAWRRKVRFALALLGLHLERLPSPAHLVGFNRLAAASVNDVTTAATVAKYDASRRSSLQQRFRSR